MLPEKPVAGNRLECPGLQVDQVDAFGRVPDDLVRGRVYPETGLSRSKEDRVVVAQPLHCSGSQSRHQPDEAIFSFDAGRPPELVGAEGDA